MATSGDKSHDNVDLRLGDIVRLLRLESGSADGSIFMISYISPQKIELTGEGGATTTLRIADGRLEDQDVKGIEILSRSEE